MLGTEIKLYLSEDEKIAFLKKKGFNVETVKSWYNENERHNDVRTYDCMVKIVYALKRPSKEELRGSRRALESKYGVEFMFNKMFKYYLLNLL